MLANQPCCIHCSHGGFPDTHTRPCDRCALAPTSEWEPLYRAEKARADAAEAAVARVRALHQPLERRDFTECAYCIDTADWQYPCATVQALDAP